jgi:hypothetical protein
LIPSILLLAKIFPRLSALGNPAVAILVGIGAAVAIGGAVTGTILPQTSASINAFGNQPIINALILLVSTLTTLIYFQFNVGKKTGTPKSLQRILKGIGWVGQFFVAVTFGALFTGVYVAVMTALIERFSFLWTFIRVMFLSSTFSGNLL